MRDYRPDPAAEKRTEALVRATGGAEASPGNTDALVRAVRSATGSGPQVEQGRLLRVLGLAPWLALATSSRSATSSGGGTCREAPGRRA